MERTSFTLAAALGGAMLAGAFSLAHAQAPARPTPTQGTLGDMLGFRSRNAPGATPPVARYVAEGVMFTFDRSASTVRFEGGNEIFFLQRQQAPRGDVIYFNDVGEPVLRVSGLGGMTLFTSQRPQGMPVALVASAPPMRMEEIRTGADLLYRMGSASNRISRLMGRIVGVDAGNIGPASSNLLADVISLTVQAFEKNAGRDRVKSHMQRIGLIEIVEGPAPAAKVEGDTLKITITASKGVAGRPSSERIARALAR